MFLASLGIPGLTATSLPSLPPSSQGYLPSVSLSSPCILLSECLYPNFPLIRTPFTGLCTAHPTPISPHLNSIKSPKILFANKVTFTSITDGCYLVTKSCPTLCNPWTAACQAPLSSMISWSLLEFISIESVMLSNHLILCHSLFLFLQSFPASEYFPMSQLFTAGGQSIGASALASVLPMTIQGWFPLGLTGLISL